MISTWIWWSNIINGCITCIFRCRWQGGILVVSLWGYSCCCTTFAPLHRCLNFWGTSPWCDTTSSPWSQRHCCTFPFSGSLCSSNSLACWSVTPTLPYRCIKWLGPLYAIGCLWSGDHLLRADSTPATPRGVARHLLWFQNISWCWWSFLAVSDWLWKCFHWLRSSFRPGKGRLCQCTISIYWLQAGLSNWNFACTDSWNRWNVRRRTFGDDKSLIHVTWLNWYSTRSGRHRGRWTCATSSWLTTKSWRFYSTLWNSWNLWIGRKINPSSTNIRVFTTFWNHFRALIEKFIN